MLRSLLLLSSDVLVLADAGGIKDDEEEEEEEDEEEDPACVVPPDLDSSVAGLGLPLGNLTKPCNESIDSFERLCDVYL
jgi:hypothetical protein